MRKAVIGVAAAATLLAIYFAPEDEGGVVGPAAATTRERPTSPATLATPTVAAGLNAIAQESGPDLKIHPRSAADDDLGNVFAKQSWQPETPKKIMLAQAEPAAAKAAAAPGAPPLPFQFLGRFVDEGKAAYFLQAEGRNVVARVGEKVDEHYMLDSASGDALNFTYLPLNQKQSLVVGDMN
jgi:hypothetical protein